MAIGKTLSALVTAPVDQLAARMTGIEPGDFAEPAGEPSLLPPDAISWHVFGNPVSLYVGGIAAVLLELGEPRVRHGVWDHSSFRTDPGGRLRRTGRAAMMTVYGARSRFEAMAARVRQMHGAIAGTTPEGAAYRADDPVLLLWVQAPPPGASSRRIGASFARSARRIAISIMPKGRPPARSMASSGD